MNAYHEMQKKRRHLPLRQLLAKAGHAVQQIKPVFMMGPLSVAQYLAPGIIEFDLLLIDEASQVRPVDALGAVARCKQIIVVGDEQQMPPTNFFGKMLGGDGDDDDGNDEQNARDLESVLGLCVARNLPERMLRWHYRSKHQSLIAVSNHEFYSDRLYVVPSPHSASSELGLRFHHVTDGWYDRGKSRTNRVEAATVAEAVMHHAKTHPGKSLGVGAFSVAQRDAILDEIELRRRQHPELEHFFTSGGEEPFFVKNLENIQGDERDVIYISVCYAPDEDGHQTMSFGPLQNDGGHRRLNVLISRAKERCEVFSTITSDYIDTKRARSRGVRALKTFLSYAKTGILDVPKVTGGEFDSEFERQVARALLAEGYELEGQVGVAGFYIDLAVIDSEMRGRYVLGIECDGAQYHSSRSARDRDRLRQQVLENRHWIIHRIWSTDWFNDPDAEVKKVVQAIESAQREWQRRDVAETTNGEEHTQSCQEQSIEREEVPHVADALPVPTRPYEVATVAIPVGPTLVDSPVDVVAEVVSAIVQVEGPIHVDEVVRRTTTSWGLARTGKRIKAAITNAIAHCRSHNTITIENEFCTHHSAQTNITIRDRSSLDSADLKKPEYIAPSEIRAAVRALVQVSHGIERVELASQVARLLGFKLTGKKLQAHVNQEVTRMVDNNELQERSGNLHLVERQPT